MAADKTLRFYLLAVCFVAMVCATVTTGMAIYALVKITAPELTLNAWSYSAHQSLENFRQSQFNPDNRSQAQVFAPVSGSALALPPPATQTTGKPTLSDEQLELKRQQSYQQILASHQRSALQDLVRLGIVLLVSSVLFFTHWRMANRLETPQG